MEMIYSKFIFNNSCLCNEPLEPLVTKSLTLYFNGFE